MKWWPLLALLVSPLVSAVTLDELQQRFTGQPVVRAHFEQVRTIKDMPQPLRSQGEMLIARDSGLLWDQKAPFPMTLLLDDKRMVQAINGQPPQTVTADNNPQMFQFNHLLRALFQADRTAEDVARDQVRQLLLTRYRDHGVWEASRDPTSDAMQIFARRQAITRWTKGCSTLLAG